MHFYVPTHCFLFSSFVDCFRSFFAHRRSHWLCSLCFCAASISEHFAYLFVVAVEFIVDCETAKRQENEEREANSAQAPSCVHFWLLRACRCIEVIRRERAHTQNEMVWTALSTAERVKLTGILCVRRETATTAPNRTHNIQKLTKYFQRKTSFFNAFFRYKRNEKWTRQRRDSSSIERTHTSAMNIVNDWLRTAACFICFWPIERSLDSNCCSVSQRSADVFVYLRVFFYILLRLMREQQHWTTDRRRCNWFQWKRTNRKNMFYFLLLRWFFGFIAVVAFAVVVIVDDARICWSLDFLFLFNDFLEMHWFMHFQVVTHFSMAKWCLIIRYFVRWKCTHNTESIANRDRHTHTHIHTHVHSLAPSGPNKVNIVF